MTDTLTFPGFGFHYENGQQKLQWQPRQILITIYCLLESIMPGKGSDRRNALDHAAGDNTQHGGDPEPNPEPPAAPP
jgi:hypothetical protein